MRWLIMLAIARAGEALSDQDAHCSASISTIADGRDRRPARPDRRRQNLDPARARGLEKPMPAGLDRRRDVTGAAAGAIATSPSSSRASTFCRRSASSTTSPSVCARRSIARTSARFDAPGPGGGGNAADRPPPAARHRGLVRRRAATGRDRPRARPAPARLPARRAALGARPEAPRGPTP